MSSAYEQHDPYAASLNTFAADAELSERLAFLRRVYAHVFAGILALVGLEYLYMTTPIGGMIFGFFSQYWFLALIGFVGVCFVAQSLAFSGASPAVQYLGLGMYVLVESFFVAPAIYYAMMVNPDLIGQAAFLTVAITGALTLFVVVSKKDFSFLRNALFLGTMGILGLVICSMFFGGFNLGIGISVAIVVLMCGYILYETSLIMHHLPTTAHVAGALMIFGSIAQLFKHLIYLLGYLNND
jgi:FtsH-binding integral membrane protein